jgi:hypothetical protein
MAKKKESMQVQLLHALKDIAVTLKEVRDEQRAIRQDVGAGVRKVPVPVKRDPQVAVDRADGDGGRHHQGVQPESGEDVEARKRADEKALNEGVHAAVSSYSPPGHTVSVPPRSQQEKTLYRSGEIVMCGACDAPVYEVRDEITTLTRLATLKELLLPYSDKVPALTADTKMHTMNGAAFDCPLCGKEGGVPLI